jgi:hypothetical protein
MSIFLKSLRIGAAFFFLAPAAFGNLEQRVEHLEAQMHTVQETLERLTGLPEKKWSCVARCGELRGNREIYETVYGEGESVIHAFQSLDQSCQRTSHRTQLYIEIEENPYTGQNRMIQATFQNACIREALNQR